jgi:hypothetical protein
MLPAKFGSILPNNFKGEDFFKQELPLVAIFVGGTERNGETLVYRGPYIDADVKCKLKTCSACQNLQALQF